jgi:hypothetical protein
MIRPRVVRNATAAVLFALTSAITALSAVTPAAAKTSGAPGNDGFAHAAPVPVSGAVAGTTAGATAQHGEPNARAGDRTVWFTWTPTKPGQAFIVSAVKGAPVTVRAYTGTRLAALHRVVVAPAGGSHALATIDAFVGVTYSLQVESTTNPGSFDLTILQPAAGTPPNSSAATATPLASLIAESAAHTDKTATLDGTTAGAKAQTHAVGPAVWYSWSAPKGAGGSLELTLTDVVPRGALQLQVFSGSPLRAVGPAGADADVKVAGGRSYAIRVSGASAYFELGVRSRGVAASGGPQIICSPAPRTWFDHNVAVPCVVHDPVRLSGRAKTKFRLRTAVAKNTSNAYAKTGTARICDRDGGCAVAGPVAGIKVDRAPPVISCSSPPTGVFDAPVPLACTAYDPPGGSGLRDPADHSFMAIATTPIKARGLRTVYFKHAPVCDRAGNCTRLPALKPVKIERTPPTVHCAAAPRAWVSHNVRLQCTAKDSGSGLDAPGDARFTLATSVVAGVSDAHAYTAARAVCNQAGDCVKVGPYGPIRVARELPTVTCKVPTGWHRGTRAEISCDAKSHGPRLKSAKDASFSLSVSIRRRHEAIKRSGTRRVCDAAGNCATAGPFTVELDDSAPTIHCQGTPHAWFTHSVTDACTVADYGSGVAPAHQLIKLTASLAAGKVSSSVQFSRQRVCDKVGNCARTPRLKPARIDRRNPRVTCASPGSGVHTENVTISCQATTGGRGPGLANGSDAWFTLGTDVAAGRSDKTATTNTHEVCDQAGNCTEVGPIGPISVDLAGSNGGLKAVPTVERVLVAQQRPTTSTGDAIVAPYVDPGMLPGTGPTGVCSPAPGTPLRLGETTVVCGITTTHGLRTRPIQITVALASNLEPHGPARAGQGWRAVGRGFGGHSTVIITLDGVAIATARAAKNGTVTAWFVMPPGLAAGPHHLAVTGRDGQGRPLIVATPLTVSTAPNAGSGGAPLPIGPVTPITPLTLTDAGGLVAPNGTKSFHSSPPPVHRRRRHRSS